MSTETVRLIRDRKLKQELDLVILVSYRILTLRQPHSVVSYISATEARVRFSQFMDFDILPTSSVSSVIGTIKASKS